MRFVIGIDPGVSGAVALYDAKHGKALEVIDTPVMALNAKTKVVNGTAMAGAIRQWHEKYVGMGKVFDPFLFYCQIESVASRPGQGVRSMFTFGRAMGSIEGVIQTLAIPYGYVSSPAWKRHFKLGKDKEVSRARAIALFPNMAGELSRKKDSGRAEALLIARHAVNGASLDED